MLSNAFLEHQPVMEPLILEPIVTPKSTGPWSQTPSPTKVRKKLKSMSGIILRQQKTIGKQEQEIRVLKKRLDSPFMKQAEKIQESAQQIDNFGALFLCNLIMSFGKSWFKWSEPIIRKCIIWHAKSPRAYRYARTMLRLPCYSTLKNYLGPTDFTTGVTSSILQRLHEEVSKLSRIERHCSLIFDEMSVKPMLVYARGAGRLIGYANAGGAKNRNYLADRLLCFILKGLNTNYRIPIVYYHTRQINGEELAKLILSTLKVAEDNGFLVTRVVCDNSKVNTRALTEICNGNLTHQIEHPCDPTRPLFLSFDYCHIIKCLRNILMDEEGRKLKNLGNIMTGKFVRLLYESERADTTKQARLLSRKVVNPNNFEKMNVRRALIYFSKEVAAAIDTQRQTGNDEFRNSSFTTEYMGICRKWFEVRFLHSISTVDFYSFIFSGPRCL